MPFDPERHHRRSIRLTGYDYAANGAYFVTILTAKRAHLLGDVAASEMHLSAMGHVVESCWLAIPEHFPHVSLDAFVVMPNHLHGILVFEDSRGFSANQATGEGVVRARYIVPLHGESRHFGAPVSGDLPTVMRTFKAAVSRQANASGAMAATGIWHRNDHEKIIRNEPMLNAIRDYILANPANWPQDEHYGA